MTSLSSSELNFKESRIINKEYYERIKYIIKCPICFDIIKIPLQCDKCQRCYCSLCVKNFTNCPFRCQESHFIPSKICNNLLSGLIIKCHCGIEIDYDLFENHKKEDCIFEDLKKKYFELKDENELLKLEINQYVEYKDNYLKLKKENELMKEELNQLRKYNFSELSRENKLYKMKLNQVRTEKDNEITLLREEIKRLSKNNNNYEIKNKYFMKSHLHIHSIECIRRYENDWTCDKCKLKGNPDSPSYHCTLCDFDLCLRYARFSKTGGYFLENVYICF